MRRGWEGRFLSAPVHTLPGMAPLSVARLEELIEQATVDCYNDSEQVCGLFAMLEESLAVPFKTTVLGQAVTVTAVDWSSMTAIVARWSVAGPGRISRCSICRLPTPPPRGAEWIDAYRLWVTRTGGA